MANPTYMPGDLTLSSGTLYCAGVQSTGATITNAMVSASAEIAATKMQHRNVQVFTQAHGTASTSVRQVIHTVRGATGTIIAFRAGSVVANVGAATISIRLKKNGTNVDTAALVLDSGNAAFAFESAAGFTSTSLVVSDVLEVDITSTAGGGTLGQGLFCELTVDEASA